MLCCVGRERADNEFCFFSFISLALWESSCTTQGPASCVGAVTQVSLGRYAWGRCPLIQAFCPPHAQGMGPFLFVVGATCLFCCLFPPRSAGHSPLSGSGRSGGISLFIGDCARQLMVQALFLYSGTSESLPLCILGRNSLYLSCPCSAALGTATSVPSCLSGLSTHLRT